MTHIEKKYMIYNDMEKKETSNQIEYSVKGHT